MGEERLVKRVYRANVEGIRERGRLQRRWRNEVKELLIGRGLDEREDMVLARDRSEQMEDESLLDSSSVRGIRHPQMLGDRVCNTKKP